MKVFPILWSLDGWENVPHVIADKGYDTYEVRPCIRSADKSDVIPRHDRRNAGAAYPGVRDPQRYKTR